MGFELSRVNKCGFLRLQQKLHDKLGTGVSQQQQYKAAQCQADGSAPAPAVNMTSEQQAGINQPGEQGKDVLVIELHRLIEDVLREHDAAEQGQGEQQEADTDDAEQHVFHHYFYLEEDLYYETRWGGD